MKKVGVIGGGQLAGMMAKEAKTRDIELIVQTPNPDDPAARITANPVLSAIADANATQKLADYCDVITFENEFVNLEALKVLAEKGICFRPSLASLEPLLDKAEQRRYLQKMGLPVPRFQVLEKDAKINSEYGLKYGFPVVLKARRHGYDGRGTFILANQNALESLWNRLERPSMLIEEFIPFVSELAVMAARGVNGEVVVYPVVETEQENQVCRRVFAPASVSVEINAEIQRIATIILDRLQVVGIFGIELFLTQENQVLVNEIAPRTHNSGHFTLDACDISQFAMQLEAVTGMPLHPPKMLCNGAVMVNLLGFENSQSDYQNKREQLAHIPHAFVHWYGKTESRIGRKLGHVTVLLKEKNKEEGKAIAQKIESIWYE
ncbi:5-(carboxyamino)imidazole ribonucleotide synthase [Spirulina sp. 06S082]|uniref:5-(carboxyamino)imidazole ribonucleotide synthase n=1 Tax=Spirulina sp. 06S082 TaxID=3110248 RepID=UPI002B21B535|nr:5-(carboxyamino)imidazole ribonucleotide synthase [Spirulina sp. 06S082]MEA5469028.1 5-(carboxyamino)imidazole ribonucleotide synthase [Spirulina sp. 06S082]